MARPLRIQYPGACYHVTCRGNERRRIFVDDEDRVRFLTQLADSLETFGVTLHAYVLMDNHFHLLLQTAQPNLSEFMRRFNICYTASFNSRHDRCGHLYQGRYKALVIDADAYLLEVSRYLHLNPVRTRPMRTAPPGDRWRSAEGYHWSSLPGYLSERRKEEFVDHGLILAMAGDRASYRNYVREGLLPDTRNPFSGVRRGLILGDAKFEAALKKRVKPTGSRREQPALRQLLTPTAEFPVILNAVARVMQLEPSNIVQRQGNGIARGIVSELAYRYGELHQGDIGRKLGGIDYTAVSHLRRRLREKRTQDLQIEAQYRQSERKLQLSMSSVKI